MDVDWPEPGAPAVAPLPKLLEPKVGVVLLPTAVPAAAPKPPNVVVVPDVAAGLPNMGLVAAVAAGDPNTGPLLGWTDGVDAGLAAAPKLNAGVEDCSAGLDAPPVKLNADVAAPLAAPPAAAAAPKIDVVLAAPVVVACGAPKEPNVGGLSAVEVAADDPKLGITLAPTAG